MSFVFSLLLNIEVGGSGWFSDKVQAAAIILVASTFSTVVNEDLILRPLVVILILD